jgi:hypothetical protein
MHLIKAQYLQAKYLSSFGESVLMLYVSMHAYIVEVRQKIGF